MSDTKENTHLTLFNQDITEEARGSPPMLVHRKLGQITARSTETIKKIREFQRYSSNRESTQHGRQKSRLKSVVCPCRAPARAKSICHARGGFIFNLNGLNYKPGEKDARRRERAARHPHVVSFCFSGDRLGERF